MARVTADGRPGTSQAGSSALRALLATSAHDPRPGIVVEPSNDGHAIVDGAEEPAKLTRQDPPRARLTTADGEHDVLVLPLIAPASASGSDGVTRLEVVVDGWRFEVDLEPEARARLRERATRANGERARGGAYEVRAIIPGRVVSVDVADGDVVEAGQRVLVVEAMKMQNEIRSLRQGTVSRVGVGAGSTIEVGDLLLVVE